MRPYADADALNAEQYGKDRIVDGPWRRVWLGAGDVRAHVGSLGLPTEQQQRLVALIEGEIDLLDEPSLLETKRYIESTSYPEFLSSRAGLSPATIALFEPMTKMFSCTGNECLSVMEGLIMGYPGLKSLGLTGKLANKLYGAMTRSWGTGV